MTEPRHAEDARALLRAVQEVAHAREIDALTGVVKRAALELTGADGVTFVLRDGDECYYVDEDAIAPLWKGRRFPAESCISGWAMRHRETVAIEDVFADDRIPHDVYRATFVKSLAMVPVRSSDPVAALGAYWARRHRPDARELELLQSLADATAVAIENVQLLRALEQRADENARLLERFREEVTRRTRAEERFQESQKRSERMESVGRLAGGVAHDFKNLLFVIAGYSDMARERAGADAELKDDLEQIGEAAERATALTRQLLAFCRREEHPPVRVDPNALVLRMEGMLRRVLGEEIELVTKLDPHLEPVTFADGQMEQALLNLALNARDAMPEGGRLTIETATLAAREASKPRVRLAVSDTGAGMNAETRARAFEPFFTTKEPGKGTGLGLATVRSLVTESGGELQVESEPGRGSTFELRLPAEESAEPPSAERRARPPTA